MSISCSCNSEFQQKVTLLFFIKVTYTHVFRYAYTDCLLYKSGFLISCDNCSEKCQKVAIARALSENVFKAVID